MAVGSERRRQERRPQVRELFPDGQVEAVLDLLHLADLAWHDCYGPQELAVPARVLDDVLLLADGDLARLVRVVLGAVTDFRDIRTAADAARLRAPGRPGPGHPPPRG